MSLTSTAFTPARAASLAQEAATRVGLAHESIELIRMGTSAVLRLSAGVIARVSRDISWSETAAREVRVATALHRVGVPCVLPSRVAQPVVVDGHPITFWIEIPGPLTEPSPTDFGAVLRLLHGVDHVDDGLDLPQIDPWGRTPERIEEAPVTDSDRATLRAVLEELQTSAPEVQFELSSGIIHGDAYLGNMACGADGATVLLDLDSICVGPREWDLVPMGLYATSLGWLDRADYQAFVDAYGFDVTTSPAFPWLVRHRELRMTAWLAMHAAESDRVADEVAHRVACLADPDLPRHWSAR